MPSTTPPPDHAIGAGWTGPREIGPDAPAVSPGRVARQCRHRFIDRLIHGHVAGNAVAGDRRSSGEVLADQHDGYFGPSADVPACAGEDHPGRLGGHRKVRDIDDDGGGLVQRCLDDVVAHRPVGGGVEHAARREQRWRPAPPPRRRSACRRCQPARAHPRRTSCPTAACRERRQHVRPHRPIRCTRSAIRPGPTVSAILRDSLRLFLPSCEAQSRARPRPRSSRALSRASPSTRDRPGSDSCSRPTSSVSRCSPGRCSPNAVPATSDLERCRETADPSRSGSPVPCCCRGPCPAPRFLALRQLLRAANRSPRQWLCGRRRPPRGRCAAWSGTTHPQVVGRRWFRPWSESPLPRPRRRRVRRTSTPRSSARPEVRCDGSEQGVDRRPVPVLRRALRQAAPVVVTSRWRSGTAT